MLTEAEKKWLEEREQVELRHGLYSCGHCKWHSDVFDEYTGYCAAEFRDCPIMGNFRDAAEFEARVAAKLAEKIPLIMRMARVKDSDYVMSVEMALYLARIEVEEEMDRPG